MSYVKKTLQPDEAIKFEAKISLKPLWIFIIEAEFILLIIYYFFPPLFKNDFMPASNQLSNLGIGALFIFLTFFGLGGISIIFRRIASELAVTNKRVVFRFGIISRKTEELDRSAIESVELSQGIWGRIFNYGNIKIRGRGIGDIDFKGIDSPVECRNAIRSE